MSFNKILPPIIIILLLFCSSGCGNTPEKSSGISGIISANSDNMSLIKKIDEATNIYRNNRFKFSVEYPKEWNIKEDIFYEANAEHNSSPDGGITIYVNNEKDNTLYIFGQFGHGSVVEPGFSREDFVTNSGLKGSLFREQIEGKEEEHLILNEGTLGAHVRISSECFNENKQEILNILKSIKNINQ